ncbi:hypothetical protein Y1Q_0021707 [Alligator mississippiensis]|uniref:Uncharacterized protein n=1 Tax=Alligator mississippiensis TaxID=8496 RepID=A0A151PB53_ALLMI|nr:hypothetical protein Y1Q_0021707 [Alligator mississippiensis]
MWRIPSGQLSGIVESAGWMIPKNMSRAQPDEATASEVPNLSCSVMRTVLFHPHTATSPHICCSRVREAIAKKKGELRQKQMLDQKYHILWWSILSKNCIDFQDRFRHLETAEEEA